MIMYNAFIMFNQLTVLLTKERISQDFEIYILCVTGATALSAASGGTRGSGLCLSYDNSL